MQEPLPEVIGRVKEAGFEGVQFARRFQETDPAATAAALEENGITPVAAHADLPDIEGAAEGENDLLERCEAVGCDRVIVPHVAPIHFRSRDTVRALSDRLVDVATDLGTYGMELGYHTTRFDCYPFLHPKSEKLLSRAPVPEGVINHARRMIAGVQRNGETVPPSDTGLWNLFSRTQPDNLFFELEAAEIAAAGFDPAAVLPLFEGRAPLVQLRDVGPTSRFGAYENVRKGEGVVDFETLADVTATEGVEWLVYEDETGRSPGAKLTEGAAFFDRLLDAERSSARRVVGEADD
jgi:sugar phosphate isomerase/epimerase